MSGISPEQAATVTPGQAAYEEFCRLFPYESWGPWEGLAYPDKDDRPDWEKIAQAAIDAKPGSERVAELVTEGNELRALVDEILGELLQALGADDDSEPEPGETPGRHAIRIVHYLRERIDELHRLIAEEEPLTVTEHFAAAWRELITEMPGTYRCTYTCAEANAAAELYRTLGDEDAAKAIIAAHADYDEEGDEHYPPAVVTAGTEHLVPLIRGLAIPDEEN